MSLHISFEVSSTGSHCLSSINLYLYFFSFFCLFSFSLVFHSVSNTATPELLLFHNVVAIQYNGSGVFCNELFLVWTSIMGNDFEWFTRFIYECLGKSLGKMSENWSSNYIKKVGLQKLFIYNIRWKLFYRDSTAFHENVFCLRFEAFWLQCFYYEQWNK